MARKVKIKDSAYILKESEHVYQVVFTAIRKVKRFQVDSLVKEVISKVKEEGDLSEIVGQLKVKYPLEDISACIDALKDAGIVYTYESKGNIDPRYKKQLSLINELTNSWEETLKLQKRLQDSKIAVFGIGGIGTWIVNGLYQIGIGEIRISDPDKVDVTNLNRQLYFTEADIGRHKVDVVKEKLPGVNIKDFRKTVSQGEDLEDIIKGCDFLVNCADNPSVAATSKIINRYAVQHNLPFCIAGGYNMHLGMVGPIFVPGKTACYNCFLDSLKENTDLIDLEIIKNADQTGSLGPIAGAVANIQVMQIFKFIINKGAINFNRFAEIDFLDFDVAWTEVYKRPSCKNLYCK